MYEAPEAQVLEVKSECFLCASGGGLGGPGDLGNGGDPFSSPVMSPILEPDEIIFLGF